MKVLNIGSGPYPYTIDDYIGFSKENRMFMTKGSLAIDNMSDNLSKSEFMKYFKSEIEDLKKIDNREIIPIKYMDANIKLDFKDNEFDGIYSNQCVGMYVFNYVEISRVLKPNGRVLFTVYVEHLLKLIGDLLIHNFKINHINIANGSIKDMPTNDCSFEVGAILQSKE
jgi:SAM-dependent methyltransferase